MADRSVSGPITLSDLEGRNASVRLSWMISLIIRATEFGRITQAGDRRVSLQSEPPLPNGAEPSVPNILGPPTDAHTV